MANGELKQYDDSAKRVLQWAHDNPDAPEASAIIQKYKADTSPQTIKQYTNDGQLIEQAAPPKFAPIEIHTASSPKPQPEISQEPSLGEKAIINVGKAVGGAAVGVGEVMNPLAIPHGVETLARGAYNYATTPKSFFDAIAAGDQESATAQMSLKQVAPILRSIVRKGYQEGSEFLGGDTKAQPMTDIYDQEVAAQNQFQNDPLVSGAQTGAELAGAAASVGTLVKDLSKAPGITQALTKLKGLSMMQEPEIMKGLSSNQIKQSAELQRKLLGELPKELQNALYNNTEQIKTLLAGDSESRSALPTVQKIRDSLNSNFQTLTEAASEFRKALTTDKPDVFDTSIITNKIDDFISGNKMSGGRGTMASGDVDKLNNIKNYLENKVHVDPILNAEGKVSNLIDTRDASIMIDKIDDVLVRDGFYEGKNKTRTNSLLSEIRGSIDEELAARYPAWKETKQRWADFKDNYEALQGKLGLGDKQGLNAENFINDLFGRGKTETRQLLESTLNKAQETKDAFQKGLQHSDNISETNQAYNNVVAGLRKKADQIKVIGGKEVMDEITNKAIARKLSTLSDPQQDTIRNLVETYTDSKINKIKGATTTAGSLLSGAAGMSTHNPVYSMLGLGLTYGANQAVEGIARPIIQAKAEKLYSLQRLLDAVEKDKKAAESSGKIVEATKYIWDKLGPDSALEFFGRTVMSEETVNDFRKAMQAQGALKLGTGTFGENVGYQKKPSFADSIKGVQ